MRDEARRAALRARVESLEHEIRTFIAQCSPAHRKILSQPVHIVDDVRSLFLDAEPEDRTPAQEVRWLDQAESLLDIALGMFDDEATRLGQYGGPQPDRSGRPETMLKRRQQLLQFLREAGTPVTLRALAERLGVTFYTARQLVVQLRDEGLVETPTLDSVALTPGRIAED